MSKETLPQGVVSTEYLTDASQKAMKSAYEFSDKISDSFAKLFGKATDKICEKPDTVCFSKKKLGAAVIILIVLALLLCFVAALVAYSMGKDYVEVDETNYVNYPNRERIEPYIDYEGEGINY
jgi:hypothetical protein